MKKRPHALYKEFFDNWLAKIDKKPVKKLTHKELNEILKKELDKLEKL